MQNESPTAEKVATTFRQSVRVRSDIQASADAVWVSRVGAYRWEDTGALAEVGAGRDTPSGL